MKKCFFVFLCSFLLNCNSPRAKLILEEISLISPSGDVSFIKTLSDIKSTYVDSSRLDIKYAFKLTNLSNVKSGLLRIDKNAFFKAYINQKIVIDRSSGYFMDTLLSTKRDSFIYPDKLCSSYFIDFNLLQKSGLSKSNTLIIKFDPKTHYDINHEQTQLHISTNNQNYPNLAPAKKLYTSKSPWISIRTSSRGIVNNPKNPAKLIIKNGDFISEENIKIEIRGNTSQSFKKKSFSFNVYNKNWNLKKIGLLNLPIHEHWVLYGPYADKSLIRNVLAYSLWEQMGYYSPKTKFCELSINGFYQGVYVLCEKIRVDTSRLNLENGCLLKIDRPKGEFFASSISHTGVPKTVFEIKYPVISELSLGQKNQIQSFVHLFEESLFLSDENSLVIFEILDMSSFIDYLIINEFCKNIDAYRLSTYFQITKDNKIKMGPIWDFNFSFGLTNYLDGYKTSGFVYTKMDEVPFWWKKLNQNLFFKSALSKRWKQLRASVLSNDAVLEMLSLYSSELKVEEKNNFDKWHLLGQKKVWPNYYIGKTHPDEIEYLKAWTLKRANWLDQQWKD